MRVVVRPQMVIGPPPTNLRARAVDWFNGKILVTFPGDVKVPNGTAEECERLSGGDRDYICGPDQVEYLRSIGFDVELGGSLAQELKEFQRLPTAKEVGREKQETLPVTGTLEAFIEAGKVEPLVPPEKKKLIVSYIKPVYRLETELKKKGFYKHTGYTIADVHYERRLTGETPIWTQGVWLIKGEGTHIPKGEERDMWSGSATNPGKWIPLRKNGWTPCWNPNPSGSECELPMATADEAVDQILSWVDEYDREGGYLKRG